MTWRLILFLGISLFFIGCASDNISLIRNQIQNKDYEKAKSLLVQQLEDNNARGNEGYFQNDEIYYYLGIVECELGNYSKGLADFSHSLYISSGYDEQITAAKDYYFSAIFKQGVSEYENDKLETGLKLFQLSLDFKTDDVKAREYLALAKQKIYKANDTTVTVIADSSIAFFSGTGKQTTGSFICNGKWTVEWFNDGNVFQIFLYNMDDELINKLTDSDSSGRGSIIYSEKGNYYFKINAVGNWKINVMPVK